MGSVYRDWVALASSGAFVLLAVGAQFLAKGLPAWASRAAAVICLMTAATRTWQLKHREAMTASRRHQELALADRLGEYLEPALEILNRHVESGDAFRKMVSDHQSWMAALRQTMTELGCAPQEIRTMEEVKGFEIRHYSDDPTTNQEKSVLSERIGRLKRVINGHGERGRVTRSASESRAPLG